MLLALLMVVPATLAMASTAADAADPTGYDKEFYCYGDNPIFSYDYNTGYTVTWDVRTVSGDTLPYKETGADGREITVSLEGVDEDVVVTQTVTDGDRQDVERMIVHPMHVLEDEDDRFTVRFLDGGNVLSIEEITTTTVVEAGDDFFTVPADPVKDGFRFIGWYVDPDALDSMVDPSEPLKDDLDLYARWGSGTGGGTHTVTVQETHVVTFDMVNGLRYDIVSVEDDRVEFLVSVADGYTFDMSSLSVTSDNGIITRNGDAYVLDEIDGDTVVRIDGDRLYTVDYRLGNASVEVPGYEAAPGTSVSGVFEAFVSPAFGWAGLSVTVLMDGEDITSECVHGGTVHIDSVSGDLVIIADASIPWLYILIVVVIVIAVIAAVLLYRRFVAGRS